MEKLRLPMAFVAILFQIATACAMETPAMKGRVSDHAGVLTPAQIESIAAKTKEVEDKLTAQIAVVTVPALPKEGIDAFANQIFNDWRLGVKDKDNGVLVLIAPTARKIRIEVGRGLEGAIPDSVAKRIISERFVPKAKAGDYAGGAFAVVEALASRVGKEVADNPEMGRQAPTPPDLADLLVIVAMIAGGVAVGVTVVGRSMRMDKPKRSPTADLVDHLAECPASPRTPAASSRTGSATSRETPRRVSAPVSRSYESSYEPSSGYVSSSGSSWTSSGPSSSNDSFSGGGGGSDGGGASGDW